MSERKPFPELLQEVDRLLCGADQVRLSAGRRLYERNQAACEAILTPDYKFTDIVGLQPGQQIRHYQVQAIELLRLRKSLLLGDAVGLGKTYTAAGFLLLPGALPGAVVVQTHLQQQRHQKVCEFTNLTVHNIKGTTPYPLPKADIYIFRYSQLLGWVDTFDRGFFKSVVYDEIQELRRGTDSAKGSAAKVLSQHATYRLGLSATPIYNYGTEIWNVLQYVGETVLGEHGDFMREWAPSGNVTDPKALGTYLREQHVFLRRTKQDVKQDLPPVSRLVEYVDSDASAIDAIESLAYKLAMQTQHGLFQERGQAARMLDMLARHATGVSKAKSVAQFVRILLDADVPVMLVGWHRDVYATWLHELADFKPAMYTGSESPSQKEKSKKAFLTGQTKLLIMSLRSGAGVDDLQHVCSTVVFGELDWSAKIHEQVIGRFDREGQKDPVTAFFLNSEAGSDPPMVDLLALKSSEATGITDPDLVFEFVKNDLSRIQALAAQFLQRRGKALPPQIGQPEAQITDFQSSDELSELEKQYEQYEN